MFIRDSNGALLNLNNIVKMNVQLTEEYSAVVAHYVDENGKGATRTIYKDKELQYCQQALENIARKVAVNYEVWEV